MLHWATLSYALFRSFDLTWHNFTILTCVSFSELLSNGWTMKTNEMNALLWFTTYFVWIWLVQRHTIELILPTLCHLNTVDSFWFDLKIIRLNWMRNIYTCALMCVRYISVSITISSDAHYWLVSCSGLSSLYSLVELHLYRMNVCAWWSCPYAYACINLNRMASTTHIFLSHLKVLPHNMANAYINYYIVYTFYAFWMQIHILFNWIVPSVVLNEPNTSLKYSIMIFRLDCDGHSIKFDNYGIAYQYAKAIVEFWLVWIKWMNW